MVPAAPTSPRPSGLSASWAGLPAPGGAGLLSWQEEVERAVIMPVKWVLWATALGFWILTHPNHAAMPVAVFGLFTIGAMANLGFTYLWWARRVAPRQIFPVALASWLADLLFVTALVLVEQHLHPGSQGPVVDFHLFFFIIVLRGFSLFSTPRQNLSANLVVVALYLGTIASLPGGWSPMVEQAHWIRGAFILLLVVLSLMIVGLLDGQKRRVAAVEARLAQAETFGLLGQLAGSLAHEMNNPMAIIAAQADYLRRSLPPDHPQTAEIAALGQEARRCGRILGNLMQFARGRRGLESRVDLGALAKEVAELLPSQRVAVEVRAGGTADATITTDPAVARLALLATVIYANSHQTSTGQPVGVEVSPAAETGGWRVAVKFHQDTPNSGESSSIGGGFSAETPPRPGIKAVRQAMEALGGSLEDDVATGGAHRSLSLVFPPA